MKSDLSRMRLAIISIFVFGLLLSSCSLKFNGEIKNVTSANKETVEKNMNADTTAKIDVELIVSGNNTSNKFTAKIEPGKTVIDLMKLLAVNDNFEFKSKESSLGAFVEEINGLKNDSGKNMYWLLYINDLLSDVGASQYIITIGDKIEWKFVDTSNIKL